MGASSSGLLDEAKISHIKGKTNRSPLFLFFFLSVFSVICSCPHLKIRPVHTNFISQPYLKRDTEKYLKLLETLALPVRVQVTEVTAAVVLVVVADVPPIVINSVAAVVVAVLL